MFSNEFLDSITCFKSTSTFLSYTLFPKYGPPPPQDGDYCNAKLEGDITVGQHNGEIYGSSEVFSKLVSEYISQNVKLRPQSRVKLFLCRYRTY